MEDVLIRQPRQEEIGQLTDLMHAYIVDFYNRPAPPEERVHSLIQMCFAGREGLQFVAEQNGELVGFATLYFTYSTLRACKTAVMNDLYVVERARGTSVATALFKACEAHVKENGYASMSWETAADNKRAQAFYAKMGGVPGDWITYSI